MIVTDPERFLARGSAGAGCSTPSGSHRAENDAVYSVMEAKHLS